MLPSKGYLAASTEGLIYYFNTMDRNVRVFGSEGTFIREFGRAGQGPGEFMYTFGWEEYPTIERYRLVPD
ncbi:6-bladed beta-propeller [Gemmatimonadota bacterium]